MLFMVSVVQRYVQVYLDKYKIESNNICSDTYNDKNTMYLDKKKKDKPFKF